MKKVNVGFWVIFLILFALNIAIGQDWQTVYETDFSSDPGWITNNANTHYWVPLNHSCEGICRADHPCYNAVDGDWMTSAVPDAYGASINVIEYHAKPDGVSGANWHFRVMRNNENIEAKVYYWDYVLGDWVEFFSAAVNTEEYETIFTEPIPANGLLSSPVRIKTYIKNAGGMSGEYFEGVVDWIYPDPSPEFSCEGTFRVDHECYKAVDGDWMTSAVPDAYGDYVNVIEYHAKPDGVSGANWRFKVLNNTDDIDITAYYWNYDSGDWEVLYDTPTNTIDYKTYTIPIPAEGLLSSPVKTKMYVKNASSPLMSGEYFEGVVDWIYPGPGNEYFTGQYNINYGGEYTYHDAGYHGGSFKIEYDIIVDNVLYASDLSFGLFDSDLNTSTSNFIRVGFTNNDQGNVVFMSTTDNLGNNSYVVDNVTQWVIGNWYTVILEYDNNTNDMTADVIERETGTPVLTLNMAGAGPFDPEMGLIGNSNVRSGPFQVPGAHTSGRFDNVSYALHDYLYIPPVDISCISESIHNDGFTVPVRFDCATPTTAMNIPIKWDVPNLVLDSVEFTGTAVEGWGNSALIDNDNQTVLLGLLGFAEPESYYIDRGTDSEIARLRFKYTCDLAQVDSDLSITLDTTFMGDVDNELIFGDTALVPNGFVPVVEFSELSINPYRSGDANGDCAVNILDIVYIINHKYKSGPAPTPLQSGDVNADCNLNILDIVYLINFKYKNGQDPECGCYSGGGVFKQNSITYDYVADAEMSASYSDGKTLLEINSPVDLAALDVTLQVTDGSIPGITNKLNGMNVYSSQKGDEIKLALLDITGNSVISSGKNIILEINGEVEILSALGVDQSAAPVRVELVNGVLNDDILPDKFELSQNFPNPFNPTTEISLSLPIATDWKITIYNVAGQTVKQFSGFNEAGVVNINWDASRQASGIYLYKAEAGTFTDTKKMLLLK